MYYPAVVFFVGLNLTLLATNDSREPGSIRESSRVIQDQQEEIAFRKVEIVAPSISCFSRFRDSLKREVGNKTGWIQSVNVRGLGKRVLKNRPKFDFGNDVVIEFRIHDRRTLRELANLIHSSGLYSNTKLWVVQSGHKMADERDIPFSELLR